MFINYLVTFSNTIFHCKQINKPPPKIFDHQHIANIENGDILGAI